MLKTSPRFLPCIMAFGLMVLSACEVAGPAQRPDTPAQPEQTAAGTNIPAAARAAARRFVTVVETVEPVAERECRRRAPRSNCDFLIVVDDRPNQPPNAFQTVDKFGRPVIAFNLGLIAAARNEDELAFVMGHEAAHHIRAHLERQRRNATAGAVIFAGLAGLTGGDASTIREAQELGAAVGARSYSKDFELEADELGTVIAFRAGYDPLRGSEFFTRIPDPGNKFLGTHPPNRARIETVRKAMANIS